MAMFIKAGFHQGSLIQSESMDGEFSLEELQSLVGGYIQVIPLKKKLSYCGETYSNAVCHEDGKNVGLRDNPYATNILSDSIFPNDYLVGNIVLLTSKELQ